MGTEQGWHLLLACREPSFLCLRLLRSCFAPDGNHGALVWLHWRQDQTPGEERGWQTPGVRVLSQRRHLIRTARRLLATAASKMRALLSAKGDFHLHLVPPPSWLQQPWPQVPEILFPGGASFSPSCSALQGALVKRRGCVYGQAIEIVPSTDKYEYVAF